MVPRPRFTSALARLVPGDARRARAYRPLIAAPALLRRSPGAATWSVALSCDRRLLPAAPRQRAALDRLVACLSGRGVACRVGAALAGPIDVSLGTGASPCVRLADITARRLRLEIYGWALLYQPPGMRGRALVDADDRFTALPAVFELPLELLDRAEFLEARGYRTRPLIVPTLAEDFVRGPDGHVRNRFFPDVICAPPCSLDRLVALG